jgi:hypothetical protein
MPRPLMLYLIIFNLLRLLLLPLILLWNFPLTFFTDATAAAAAAAAAAADAAAADAARGRLSLLRRRSATGVFRLRDLDPKS